MVSPTAALCALPYRRYLILWLSYFPMTETTRGNCRRTGFFAGMDRHNHRYWKHTPTQLNTKEKTMKTKEEYIESLTSELKEWSAQIDLLTAKMEDAADDVKLKYAEELDALRAKQHEAAEKMKELEEASGDAWGAVKTTADKVWNDIRIGVDSIVSKFK